MKKWLLLATSLLVLNANPASACSCIRSTPQQNFARASTVFSGRVIDIQPSLFNEQRSINERRANPKIRFEVSRVWKGKLERQSFVMTSGSSASCGYAFQKGKEYLVYASEQDSTLQTGLCSGTKLLSEAQSDLAALGQGKTPNQKDSNKAQLQQNKQLWAKQKISNYRYKLRKSCFCFPKDSQVTIEARNGKFVSIAAANSGQSVNPESFTKYNSIAKLFDLIDDAIAKNAHRISVTYHPTLGYPTQISIDYDQYIADEEISLTIENLEARQR